MLSAQMSKLYYPKATVAAAIHRFQIRRYSDIFRGMFESGHCSVDRLCARLRQDDRGILGGMCKTWFKDLAAEFSSLSLSRAQQRRLRDAWLEQSGSAPELCIRIGGSMHSVGIIMAAHRWLQEVEQDLKTIHACRCAMHTGAASLRDLADVWWMTRKARSEEMAFAQMRHMLEWHLGRQITKEVLRQHLCTTDDVPIEAYWQV